MNGINSIRLDLNTARYNSATAKKRVSHIDELKNSTETDKKKQDKKQIIKEFELQSNTSQGKEAIVIAKADNMTYRASLLNEIVNKMSGLEKTASPGQYIEYYA